MIPALIGYLTSIVAYVLLFGAVYKLMTIATDLREIKELLKEQKREHDARALVHPPDPATARRELDTIRM